MTTKRTPKESPRLKNSCVIKNYRISADDICYFVEKRYDSKDGKVSWRDAHYFSNLEGVFRFLADRMAMDNLSDLEHAVKQINEIKDMVLNLKIKADTGV